MLTEPIAVTLQVIDVLEALDIPYFIGGSLAIAMYGLPRSTMDTDLVADMNPEHIEPLVQALSDAFYANAEMILGAIQHRGSFNLIHPANKKHSGTAPATLTQFHTLYPLTLDIKS